MGSVICTYTMTVSVLSLVTLSLVSAVPLQSSQANLGVVQREVRKYLVENQAEDITFILGTVCTIESAPTYSDNKIEACSACWDNTDDVTKTEQCMDTYMSRSKKACESEIDQLKLNIEDETAGKNLLQCFLNFVRKNDPQKYIQNEVRKWLDDNPTSYAEFIIGTSCTIESGPSYDEDQIDRCARCWPENPLTPAGVKKTKECAATYLPNIARTCKTEIAKMRPKDSKQGERVSQCFLKYVKDNDFP